MRHFKMPDISPFAAECAIWLGAFVIMAVDIGLYFWGGKDCTFSEAIRSSPRSMVFAFLYGALGWHLFGTK